MRHALRAALVTALLVTGSGCSAYDRFTTSDFARQEPAQVVAAATAAMSDLTSLRATGQVLLEGRSVFVDLAMDARGRCSGTMRTAEGRITLRRVGGTAWLTGDAGFFDRLGGSVALPAQSRSRLADGWVRADAPRLLELCALDGWVGTVSGGGDDLVLEEDDDLGNGVRSVHYSPEPGRTVWVLSEAPHHVVRVEDDARDGATLSFSDFDQPVHVQRPPAREVAVR
ncbi:hypothetical protein [Nocardioides zeicaulis]|uniref:LppX_LprAFG lipoprotein n=1 Tax=Nocardioides zeicaulis TaxID=1776857 RepID=A0ABV6E1W9_9ACTN